MPSSSVLDTALVAEPAYRPEPVPHAPAVGREATVLLIDGRPLMRECLAHAIRAEWPAACVVTAGWDTLGRAAAGERIDVCIACEDLAGDLAMDGLAESFPGAALAVISDDHSHASIARAAGRGVRGYFSTAVELRVLVQGLRLVLVGGTALPLAVTLEQPAQAPQAAPAAPRPLSRFSAELFTPKELEVLRSLASGRQNKLIAHELAICETTVKVHLRHIFRKLGTTNRTHAALLARDLLEP
jgi:DNA-binding NarL/FixJ family response regulator